MTTMMMKMKACLLVAFCGVAGTFAFAPAAPFSRDLQHDVSLSNINRMHRLEVTRVWGTSSSPAESSTDPAPVPHASAVVQLPNAVASFCVGSLLAVSLLAGPDMALARETKVAPEPTATESVQSKKSKTAAPSEATASTPPELKALDNAKATLAAAKGKVADLTAQAKKAKTENDSALAQVNKAEVAAERAKAAYIKENDRLVSLPTSATVDSIVAEKAKVAQLKQVSTDASSALSNAKTAQKATAGRLSTLESDVVKAQNIVDGAEKAVVSAEQKYQKYQSDKVEKERKAAFERKQAQEAAKKKQEEQKKKDREAAEKLKKEQQKAQEKAKEQAKKAAERQRKENEAESKKRQEQAKKAAKQAKEAAAKKQEQAKKAAQQAKEAAEKQRKVDEANRLKKQEQAKKAAQEAKEKAERAAKELANKIELAKKKVDQCEQEKRKLIVQENVPKSKIEAIEKKLLDARQELKALMKSPGK